MAIDDLNTPLGVSKNDPASSSARRSYRWILFACFAIITAGGGMAWLAVSDTGNGGRARAVAKIELDQQTISQAKPLNKNVSAVDKNPVGTVRTDKPPRADGNEIENNSGVRVVRRGGGNAPGALIITIPQTEPKVGLTPAPDRRLVQRSRYGLLPVIARDGSKALDLYARPLVISGKLRATAPRLAIVVGGMGLSDIATNRAIRLLPPAVTLAFAPYGKNLRAQVSRAREDGHEVLLQIPMEPFDLIGPGPGPQLLLAKYDRKQMKERLHWHMGRFTGYIGIANFLGAKFSANPEAMAPVIEEVRSRGLMYFDDGSSPRSLAGKIANASRTPFAQADVIIDEARSTKAIEAALLKLEAKAVQQGMAIGFANALPNVIDQISRFTPGLKKRGIALVPASAMNSAHRALAANRR